MKLSTGNQAEGRIADVTRGIVTTLVRIEIGIPAVLCGQISNEAALELGLRVGMEANAIVNASDVMVGLKDADDVRRLLATSPLWLQELITHSTNKL